MAQDRLTARARFLLSATKNFDVVANIDEDFVQAYDKGSGEAVTPKFNLLLIDKDRHRLWPSSVAEFDVFQSLCRFVAPLGYGDEEIAAAWDLLVSDLENKVEEERQCLN